MLTKRVFPNMKKKKPPVAEYMKIRRYMLHFVEQAGEQSVLAPSILELSRKFGVSRPTVSKAMKMLTDDGYIIGRPGVGAFTNPAKIHRYQLRSYRNISIIVGDGMLVHQAPYQTEMMARILLNLARQGFETSFLQLTSHQDEQILEELSMNQFSVLLWILPPREMYPVIRELRKMGRSVISNGKSDDDHCGNVFLDYEGLGYEVGRRLIAEGRSKVVYLLDNPAWGRPLAGMKQAYREAGIEPDPDLTFTTAVDLWDRLAELLNTPGKVDAVFSAVCSTSLFLPFYRQLSPEIRKRNRFILEEDYCSPDEFSGWLFQTPFQELADETIRLISLETEGISQEETHIKINIPLTETKGGKTA